MITNKDAEALVKEIFSNMENSLNSIETIMNQNETEGTLPRLGYYFGSIREDYKMIVKLLNIFQENK